MFRIFLFAGFAGITACGAHDAPAGWGGALRDSAGILVVQNPGDALWAEADAWRVQQEWVIGEATGDPALEFGSISGLDVGSDGTVYAIDRQAGTIRVIEGNGTLLRTFGRLGSGPGELGEGAAHLVVGAGDTLLIADTQTREVQRFLPTGEYVDRFRVEPLGLAWDHLRGGLVFQVMTADWNGLLRVPSGGGTVDTVLRFDYERQDLERGTDLATGRTQYAQPAFPLQPVWTVLEDGRIAAGHTGTYRITIHDPEGDVVRIITGPPVRRAVTADDRAVLERLWAEQNERLATPPQIRDVMVFEVPDSFPAFAAVAPGPEGTLLVQRIADATQIDPLSLARVAFGGQGGALWDVLDAEGRWLGTVELPPSIRLVRQHHDALYGVVRGDMDEDRIVRLTIVR